MKNELKELWRRLKPTLLWLPVLIAMVVGSYIVLRALDPRIGLEGFGDLFGYALNGVRAVAVVALAWITKRSIFFDLHDRTELTLFEKSRDGGVEVEWILWRDRIEWFFLLALFSWLLTR
jgi:hypothetical protein